ncbi:hypothetical protein [Comamonas piscis]
MFDLEAIFDDCCSANAAVQQYFLLLDDAFDSGCKSSPIEKMLEGWRMKATRCVYIRCVASDCLRALEQCPAEVGKR